MPINSRGQLITFAIETDADQKYSTYIWVTVGVHTRTVAKIAAHRGHPELARTIADLNGIRSIHQTLHLHRKIRVPGKLRTADVFHVLPQDGRPPVPTGGYAKFENIDRPERVGLTQFDGYDPIVLSVPIQFEAYQSGQGADIESDIALLEHMAGRGNAPGTAVGPPPIIHISTTDSSGDTMPLIPTNLQWRPQNPSGPTWRVTGIDWDPNPLRNAHGARIRQLAEVTLQQHTHAAQLDRSVAQRSKSKPKKKTLAFGGSGTTSIGSGLLP